MSDHIEAEERAKRAQRLSLEMAPRLLRYLETPSHLMPPHPLDWEVAIGQILAANPDTYGLPQSILTRVANIPRIIRALVVRAGGQVTFARRIGSSTTPPFLFYTESDRLLWKIGESDTRMAKAATERPQSTESGESSAIAIPTLTSTGLISMVVDGDDLLLRISNPHELDNSHSLEVSWWSSDSVSDYIDTKSPTNSKTLARTLEVLMVGMAPLPCVCAICDRMP